MTTDRPARLEDLYVVRTPDDKPLEFTTERGTVRVHIVKLNQPDTINVERRALAAKARRLATLDDHEGDDYLAHYLSVRDVDDPAELIAALVNDEMSKPMIEIEAKVRGQKKWEKDDLLESLELAWYGEGRPGIDEDAVLGLMFLHDQPPEQSDDPEQQAENIARVAEAHRVWTKLQEFQAELLEELRDRRDEIAHGYAYQGDVDDHRAFGIYMDGLRHKVIEVMVRIDAETVFTEELLRQRIYYCTRQEKDWRKRHFGSLVELDNLPKTVLTAILTAYNNLAIGDLAGKGLPPILGSSPPSESSDAEEVSTASGPVVASA